MGQEGAGDLTGDGRGPRRARCGSASAPGAAPGAGRSSRGAGSRLHPLTRLPHRVLAPHESGDVVGVDACRSPAQPQEELDVAGRPRQRAGGAPSPHPSRAQRRPRPPRSTASARRSRSRTTPPLPTRSLPTSNCGLTISARSASAAHTDSTASSTRTREMNDRSPTTTSTGSADERRGRAHGCSCGRGPAPARPGGWPRRAGRSRRRPRPPRPRRARSSTSVKPPVDAPASRQRRPATSKPCGPKAASAPVSLCPPRGDEVGDAVHLGDHDRHVGGDPGRRLRGHRARDLHPALGDQLRGVLAGAGQAATDQLRRRDAVGGAASASALVRTGRAPRPGRCRGPGAARRARPRRPRRAPRPGGRRASRSRRRRRRRPPRRCAGRCAGRCREPRSSGAARSWR